jgi:co-chaperonin GroES (HSP10)
VLIEPYEPEIKSSMLIIPDAVRQNTAVVEQRATLIEAGPEAWCEEKEPRALPGDKVLVIKFAGHLAKGTKDGKLYRLINDRDIFCVIEEEVL